MAIDRDLEKQAQQLAKEKKNCVDQKHRKTKNR